MDKILALLFTAVSLLAASLARVETPYITSIQVGNIVLNNIEIADTNIKKEQGLSGRGKIEANYGMLFVFKEPSKYSFWMKDMNFPIDMIWTDKNGAVVGLKSNATPESYPEAFGPEEEASYVLEVKEGLIEKENLKIGDSLKFLK
jgi:uncharacterized protein